MVSDKQRLVRQYEDVTDAEVGYDGREVVIEATALFEEDDRRARKHEDRVPQEFVEYLSEHGLSVKRAHFVDNTIGFDMTIGDSH